MNAQPSLPRLIALLTHQRQPLGMSRVARIVQQVIPDYANRARIEVIDTPLGGALELARRLEESQAVDAFICTAATANYLRQHLDTTVLPIHMGEYDLIRALDLARSHATRVGVISFQQPHPELARMASLFTVDIRQAAYTNLEEARRQVRRLVEEGCGVIVGSSTAIELAEEAGARGVSGLGADAIRRTLDDALAIYRSRTQADVQQQRLNAVLRHLSDGVIAVDGSGLVQSLNPRMAELIDISPEQARGRPIGEVLPGVEDLLGTGSGEENRLLKAGARTLAATVTPMFDNGEPDGMVVTCQEINEIQRADRRIRSQARPRQFTARYRFEQIVGESPALREVLRLAERYAHTDSTVLITGESGTGKELIAQSLHNASPRQPGPFVAINCAAFPESLLESELFGYEEGAFTGSRKGGKTGLIEAAHTGTLFLDEIGDMPVSLQTRLLRVLQEREVLRLGASEPTPVDIRVIAATHCDLVARIADGRFREDLYYRLNILRLAVPPLRERHGDIGILARAILRRIPALHGTPRDDEELLGRLLPHLLEHRWPGNIRELENILERAALSARELAQAGSVAELRALFPELFAAAANAAPQPAPVHDLRQLGKAAEAAHARQVLEACAGDLEEAARRLGVSRSTLWRRLKAARGN
ncbi:propionate catabolism operon regulatory protein PrpR [Pseudomonas schmalbachii]|uniref:Propionate catabolism operon regulatory protein PrpR n=1 Tax=Pseudomonas schmalbachii TaxID=2816993 RepID=A0ABS3TWC9_9PSED|nr:propionate catabolism operon regulatory protein PrpR [Pseudomonas schmalbachii]MBO3276869.1 propionate catabolism operon regulatory protein PrpR [Pseudomonas schmalbachii]